MKTILLCFTIVYSLILCLFCGCDLKSEPAPPSYTFYFQNNSEDTFGYIYSTHFPDTTLDTIILQQMDIANYPLIYPHSKTVLYYFKDSLPNFETSGTLELFLINIDTIEKYSWQNIASKYLVARRYDLTYKDIIMSDSVITYP